MTDDYIELDLSNGEKEAILEHASFFVTDDITKADLSDKRKKWIRFEPYAISQIIGELSYVFNRCTDNYKFDLLDQLICHLEYYEQKR